MLRSIRSPRFLPAVFRGLCAQGCLILLTALSSARAQEESGSDRDFRQSVALSPLFFLGGISGNYEYLTAERHGLMVEGGYNYAGPSAGSYSAGAGYRFHFSPGMEGGFLGAFVRYADLEGEAEGEVDDVKTDYTWKATVLAIGANIGTKWQWENGVALTLRGGYGYPISDVEWSPADPEPEFIETIVKVVLGLDLEFTVGYSF